MSKSTNATWTFRISDRIQAELDEFENVVARFKAGAINEGQFRIIRVPASVYEQRENGTYMLRVRFPAGGATAAHLRRLSAKSRRNSATASSTPPRGRNFRSIACCWMILFPRCARWPKPASPPKAVAATRFATLRPASIPASAAMKFLT